MREITINLTDKGWEVLVNGVPSPRFARYMRNLEWIRARGGALVTLFMLGPAKWLAMAVAMLLATGHLTIGASTSENLREARLTFHLGPSYHSPPTVCTIGRHACPTGDAVAAAEATDVKALFLVVYLAGIGFTLEQLLQRRRKGR